MYYDNILLTRNLPMDSGVRQWSHPSMIPLHCLWAKSNNRARGQFNVVGLGLIFVFILFVHMHGAVVIPQFVGEGVMVSFKIGWPRSRGWKNFRRRWTGGGEWVGRGLLKIRQFSWTPCVYYLIHKPWFWPNFLIYWFVMTEMWKNWKMMTKLSFIL